MSDSEKTVCHMHDLMVDGVKAGVGVSRVEDDDTIRVNVHDLAKWIRELRHLRAQRDQLQTRGTEMTMARQRVSAIVEKWIKAGSDTSAILSSMVNELREANKDS